MLVIVGDVADVLIACREVDAFVAVRMGYRALLPQTVPDSIGVGGPGRIEVIPIRGPVGNRRTCGHSRSRVDLLRGRSAFPNGKF